MILKAITSWSWLLIQPFFQVLSAQEVQALAKVLQVTPRLRLNIQGSIHSRQPLLSLLLAFITTSSKAYVHADANRKSSRVCMTRTELPQTARISARTELVACLDWL